SDLGGRERDGIARRDEVPVAHVDDRGIFTDLGTDDDAGILGVVLVEDRLQRVGTELAYWQGLQVGETSKPGRPGQSWPRRLQRLSMTCSPAAGAPPRSSGRARMRSPSVPRRPAVSQA